MFLVLLQELQRVPKGTNGDLIMYWLGMLLKFSSIPGSLSQQENGERRELTLTEPLGDAWHHACVSSIHPS